MPLQKGTNTDKFIFICGRTFLWFRLLMQLAALGHLK